MVDVEGIVSYVKVLQREDGSFMGDKWGEYDLEGGVYLANK